MDELTLVRDFRSSAPAAAPAAVRERALGGTTRPTPRRALRLAVAAALAITGGGVAATVLQPASPSVAAVVLGRAAAAVAADPAVTPRSDQWIHVRVLGYDAVTGEPGTHPGESWARFDGDRYAERRPDGHVVVQGLESWPLGTPQQWYDALAGLPEDPEAALTYLADDPLYASDGGTAAARDFDEVTEALTAETYLTPEVRATLYRALAAIPGVGIDDDAAPDLVGRPVLSVTFAGGATSLGRAGDRWELLLDPATYDVLGLRGTAGSDIDLGEGTVRHPGEVWYEYAVLAHDLVDHPGDDS